MPDFKISNTAREENPRSKSRRESALAIPPLERRSWLLWTTMVAACWATAGATEQAISVPIVSLEACPAEIVSAETADGLKASAVVRRPPGPGPFPAIIFLHGGLNQRNVERVKREAPNQRTNNRFLAAGYVTVEAIFRSRSEDPQTTNALTDCRAILAQVQAMPAVDPKSVVVLGHSGGGSLALELAGDGRLAAIAAGEPASILFTGMYNKNTRKRPDQARLMDNPTKYYTPELKAFTQEKIRRVSCPVLIVHGDQHPINKINHEIIIPELRAAGKTLSVIAYPGQPHNFVFGQDGSPSAVLKCFQDCDAFFRKYLRTQPVAIEASRVRQVAVTEAVKDESPADAAEKKTRKRKQ